MRIKEAAITALLLLIVFTILGVIDWKNRRIKQLDAYTCQPFAVIQAVEHNGQRVVICDSPSGWIVRKSKP